MKRLPRSLDEIRGLRAARWIRESTVGQYDRFGPASQREQQDRFIERYGLRDTGLVFQVAQSGTTVWRSPMMAQMLAEAKAGGFDLLLAGYSDRWQRNLRRTFELIEDHLHPAGVALVMCDRRILSSDPHDWDELVAEATAAERYTRRLAERVRDGYGAKFESHSDQGGLPPLGFRRSPEPPCANEIDSDTIGTAVGLFERYALGNVSIEQLGRETGLEPDRIRYILRNPLYNGWVRRHRGPDEIRRPAPWRTDPPVSDELWDQVVRVRRSKTRGGGPRNRGRVDLLAGLLECVCGRHLRSDGRFGATDKTAKLHLDPCEAWRSKARLASTTWEGPLMAQIGSISLDAFTMSQVVAATSVGRPVTLDRARVDRQLRELAQSNAADEISDEAYLERKRQLRGELAGLDQQLGVGMPAQRAVEWLRAFAESWREADVPQAKADLLHAIYERIVVAGREFVSARLTPAAYQHGLALALPEAVMARPEGFEPPTI
jgi:DNA invertase Pin-like site-specific DNA recombinase